MNFREFCGLHGLLVDSVIEGRWVRVPTADHPRKRNGAYKFLGDIGWCQNHATAVEVSEWRPESDAPRIDRAELARKREALDRELAEGHAKAASRAQKLINCAILAEHPYLHMKGFGALKGLTHDGALVVPMRNAATNALQGAQCITWIMEERRYDKKMLYGMRAKDAVFRIGNAKAARTWLVEGYATGLSVDAALRVLRLRDSVTVCFSSGNLVSVAKSLSGVNIVFADNDESGAGLRAAQATGLPYCMSHKAKQDANDLHLSDGIFSVAQMMLETINMT